MYKHTTDIHNTKAAKIIIPFLLKNINVNSVLDIGMGIGTWLKVFQDNEISEILGVDGDYVDKNLFLINEKKFKSHDLRTELNLHKKFDLVVSLEVIEHIPKEFEDIFIKTLINHGDTILFSAAIPGQGGQNHHNEQWQSYWINKFKNYGYNTYDILRPKFWNNNIIEWWYRQNMLLLSKKKINLSLNRIEAHDLVSKELYLKKEEKIKILLQQISFLENELIQLSNGQKGLKQPLKILLKALKNKLLF